MRVINLIVALAMCVAFVGCKKDEVKPKTEEQEEVGLSGYYMIQFNYNHNIQNDAINPNSPISGNVIILQTYIMGPQAKCYFKGEKGQYIKFLRQQILGSTSHIIGFELYETTPTGEIKQKLKEECCHSGYVYVYLD